jgi:hypothetical protein
VVRTVGHVVDSGGSGGRNARVDSWPRHGAAEKHPNACSHGAGILAILVGLLLMVTAYA